MLYGILGDIHSNFDALSTVIKDMEKAGVERYYCVGDIVGYAAEPAPCIETLRNLNCLTSAGNHDYAVANRIPADNFTEDAYEAIVWTKAFLTRKDKDFLGNLPLVLKEDDLTLVHGTLHNPSMFLYMTNYQHIALSFEALETRLCFIGHTHIPVAFLYKDHTISYTTETEVDLKGWQRLIINVGSVGQSRDRDWRASYVLYDTEKEKIYLKRIEYDANAAANKIYASGLPRRNGDRLRIQ